MRVCGVICEYNPFHRGHAHHLAKARERSGADYVVCVMSGPLTQRGTFARHDKWTRARMALSCGADLVLELPARFACSPAERFARGGVALLDALGVVTHLSFGCEASALPLLETANAVLRRESPAFKAALREGLSRGLPFPRARALAAQADAGVDGLCDVLAQPNAALALEYLAALPAEIEAVPVLREGAGYHDETLCALSSATAVRAALCAGKLPDALNAVPCPQLLEASEARGDVHEEESLTQALLYRLRTASPQALSQIEGMDEGLENVFLRAARTASSREALLAAVKSKRYTHARLSRLCAYVLLNVTRSFAAQTPSPTYARILGLRKDASPLLGAIKRSASLPLIAKAADYDREDPLFALDLLAQDMWSLGCKAEALRAGGRDFTTSPVIL